MLRRSRGVVALLGAMALVAASSSALALPLVRYSVNDLGGGLFKYNLIVDNQGGSEALSGLNVLKGNSVFGLTSGSVINAPVDWLYFAPLPPLIDDLDYFSLDPGADVPIDGVLGGFSFRSTRNPDTLAGDDFAVEGIGGDSASQIDLGVAILVPEPATALLLGSGLLGLALGRGRRRVPAAWPRRRRSG